MIKFALTCVALVALAACSSHTEAPADAPTGSPAAAVTAPATPQAQAQPAVSAELTEYHWRLDAAIAQSGQPISALMAHTRAPLQLDFSTDAISITNTCNAMHGSYSAHDRTLEIGDLASTLMACADLALAATDQAVGHYLRGTLAYDLGPAEDASPRLVLITQDGDRLEFIGTPTDAKRFGSAGETIFLEIAADQVPCEDDAETAPCLEVRERHYAEDGSTHGEPGAWHPLHATIEGYSHEAGVRTVLRVKRYARGGDAGATPAYVLDMVVESERAE